MALFDGAKRKQVELEQQVKLKLTQVPLLDDLIEELKASQESNEKQWMTLCQGYYDNRVRNVAVGPDLFGVRWVSFNYDSGRPEEEEQDKILYSYTNSGYRPLHEYTDPSIGASLSTQQVVAIWAELIRERMKAAFPDCAFTSVTAENDMAGFNYKVPELEWKDWF